MVDLAKNPAPGSQLRLDQPTPAGPLASGAASLARRLEPRCGPGAFAKLSDRRLPITGADLDAAIAAGSGAGAPIEHRGWCRARDRALAGVANKPAFFALLGPAGTGKTWLLHTIQMPLQQRGQQAKLVLRGELPFHVAAGTVVLVDEAATMDAERLAHPPRFATPP
jgi:hypothetical protein